METEINDLIIKEIESRVYDKIKLLKRNPHAEIDHKKIESECIKSYFMEMYSNVMNEAKEASHLMEQLQHDDPKLYHGIKERLSTYDPRTFIEDESIRLHTDEEFNRMYEIGYKWYSDGELNKAHLYFAYLSLIDASNADLWVARGMIEQQMGKCDLAVKSYTNALVLDPQNMNTYVNIINCLLATKQEAKAKQVYSEFVAVADPHLYTKEIRESFKAIEKKINH